MSVAFFAAYALPANAQIDPGLVELHQWYNPERGDTFLTTQPQWRGRDGAERDGYVWIGIAGKVFPNNQGEAAPPDTRPIYSWWNPALQDNLLTKGPDLPSDLPNRNGYRRYRLEGHVFIRGLSGTLPLLLSYDRTRGDGAARTTALPVELDGRSIVNGQTSSDTRDLSSFAIDRSNESVAGFVFSEGARSPYLERQVGYDNLPGSVEGTIPVVTFIQTFDGVSASASRRELIDFLFAENRPSMASYIRTVSGGRVRLTNSAVIGPLTIPDDPRTPPDESNLNCWTYARPGTETIRQLARLCPSYAGVDGNQEDFVLRATAKAIDDRIDLRQFDRNRNGSLDRGEVMFVSLRATPPEALRGSAQFPGTSRGGGSARDFRMNRPDGLNNLLGLAVSGVTDTTRLSTAAHETLHVISNFIDVYGSRNLNARSSLMGGGAVISNVDRELSLWHPDPWHKMRVGWARPTIREIHPASPPSVLEMTAAGAPNARSAYAPQVFFDPDIGTERLIMLESRRQVGTDSETLDDGVAAWEIRTQPGVTDNDPGRIFPVIVAGQSPSQDGQRCIENGDRLDRQMWLLSPGDIQQGCRVTRGVGPYFKPRDGIQSLLFTPARLPRPRTGTQANMSRNYIDTDLSVEVLEGGECGAGHCGHYAVIRAGAGTILEPRLDGWFSDREGNLVLTGEFGKRTRQGKVNIFRQGGSALAPGARLQTQIIEWTPTQITLRNPGAQSGSTYLMQVINGVVGRGLSNQVIYFPISPLQ